MLKTALHLTLSSAPSGAVTLGTQVRRGSAAPLGAYAGRLATPTAAWRAQRPHAYPRGGVFGSEVWATQDCLVTHNAATTGLCAWVLAQGVWWVRVPLAPAFYRNVSRLTALPAALCRQWRALMFALGGVRRCKLRFKGKSFKWHRRRGALVLRFGHSHLVAVGSPWGVRWRRQGKMKIILFGASHARLLRFAQTAIAWRPMNMYHGRGIRLRRQRVWRKAGKVSAYR